MPKISVIIPTYNCATYLPDAIDSVLAQTFKDFEIIVVDDGSTDNAGEIVTKYGLQVKYIYQENKGVSAARNTGIRATQGEFIAFLDADDIWLPTKLEKQINLFEKNDAIALVFTDMQEMLNGKILGKSYLREKGYIKNISDDNMYQGLLKKNFIVTSSLVMLKKDILQKSGLFNETYHISEDYDLWLRIAKDFKVVFLNEPLVIHRLHKQNITNNKVRYYLSQARQRKNLFKHMEETVDKKPIRNKLSKIYFELGYLCLRGEKRKRATKFFIKSISYMATNVLSIKCLLLSLLPTNIFNEMRVIFSRAEESIDG